MWPICVIMPNLIKIGQKVVEFSKWWHLPSRICWACTWTTHDDSLVVSVIVQNLVGINAIVLIWNFQYFAIQVWVFLGGDLTKPTNGTPFCKSTSFEPSSMKIRQWAWPVGDFPKKVIKNWLYFTRLPKRPPCTDLHQIWHSHRRGQRNHPWQFFWWSVKGCGFCGGSKIAISHWQDRSPLTQSWRLLRKMLANEMDKASCL